MSKKVATTSRTENGVTSWQYHDTIVAVYNRNNNTVTFDNGGYVTATTRTRMNQFCELLDLRYRAFIRSRKFYIWDAANDKEYHLTGKLTLKAK